VLTAARTDRARAASLLRDAAALSEAETFGDEVAQWLRRGLASEVAAAAGLFPVRPTPPTPAPPRPLAPLLPGGYPATVATRGAGKAKPRVSVAEANSIAQGLVKKLGKVFFALSESEQARRIGCSWKTWSRTQLYKTARKARGRQRGGPRKVSSPPAVSFTNELAAATGEGGREATLNELIAEQRADHEPSPLEDDPPGGRPRKVYTPNRRL
jgi:hypothetical protein